MKVLLAYITWFLTTALLTYFTTPLVASYFMMIAMFIQTLYLVINKTWIGIAKHLNNKLIKTLVYEIKDYRNFYKNYAIRLLMYILGILVASRI